MRHLAWLHEKPEGSKKSRLESFKQTREDHLLLQMPDIENEHAAGHIIGLLIEAGLMSSNGMGPVSLSWTEIRNWLECTQRNLSLWEVGMIKTLSNEYVAERLQATAKDAPAPYQNTVAPEVVDRDAVGSKVTSFFRSLMRKEVTTEVVD